MPLVNKRELAALLECSLPTLAALIERYPDFPVVRRGSNGVEWQFDPEAVVAFLERKREEEAAEEAKRHELLAQFRLPIDREPAPSAGGLSPQQELAAVRAMQLRQAMAREARLLVPTTDVRMELAGALAALGRFLQNLPGQLARRHNLPEAVVRDMRASIAEQQEVFVRQLREFGPAAAPPPPHEVPRATPTHAADAAAVAPLAA